MIDNDIAPSEWQLADFDRTCSSIWSVMYLRPPPHTELTIYCSTIVLGYGMCVSAISIRSRVKCDVHIDIAALSCQVDAELKWTWSEFYLPILCVIICSIGDCNVNFRR